MTKNILYSNNCLWGNCAVMMMKSIGVSAHDNVVVDSNYTSVFEISAYRMPAARMSVEHNVMWNVSQALATTPGSAYTSSCKSKTFANQTTWDNATLLDLLAQGDGTPTQRSRLRQYGFNGSQLQWPVVLSVDFNFADNMTWLRAPSCVSWDRHSVELEHRPFSSPVNASSPRTPWHSRTYLDYQIPPTSDLVTHYGFRGSFDVRKIGLRLERFVFPMTQFKRRDAAGRLQAEKYDRTSNLFTTEALGLGSGHDLGYPVPPGSWARYDGVDFGLGPPTVPLRVVVFAAAHPGGGAKIRFQLGSPDTSGVLLSEVTLQATGLDSRLDRVPSGFALYNGSVYAGSGPTGIHSVFMVFDKPPIPPPSPPDNRPHRYWRLIAGPDDFNTSFYNKGWDVCVIELRHNASGAGVNLATDPMQAIASGGEAAKAFNGLGDNCTQWDGRMGSNSNYWHPTGDPHNHQWIGYDFGPSGVAIGSIRLKQFPNQYCAATPSLEYSDNKVDWITKFRMNCATECPNNASGVEPEKGWIESPGPGTVAPPVNPVDDIGAVVDWFSFSFV